MLLAHDGVVWAGLSWVVLLVFSVVIHAQPSAGRLAGAGLSHVPDV